MQVGVTDMRSGDVLDVTMTSSDTTFAADPAALPAGCTATGPREVQCVPALATLAGGRASVAPAATSGDYTVTLPLVFPDSMVEDDLLVTASLGDAGTSQSAPFAFRPSRRPTYDVRLPALAGPTGHAVAGDLDRWTVSTSAQLPPRVRGLRYAVTAPVRFRAVDGCEVGAGGSTLTCPDLRDGDEVTLPLEAGSLSAPVTATVSVSSLVDFADADPTDQSQPVDLSPGADLGLALTVASATPDRDGSVSLAGHVSGLRDGLDRVTYRVGDQVSHRARFTADGNPSCTVADTSMTCPAPPGGDVALVLRAVDRGTATPVTVSVEPAAPFEAVGSGSHAADVTLPARLSYDFAMSDLTETAHTVAGDTDTYTLSSTVKAVPAGSGPLTFALSPGATFAARQAGGCAVVDPSHVSCGDLSQARAVDFAVETTATTAHDVTIGLQVPAAYDDPDSGRRPGHRHRAAARHPAVADPARPRDAAPRHRRELPGRRAAGRRPGGGAVGDLPGQRRRHLRRRHARLRPVGRHDDLPRCRRRPAAAAAARRRPDGAGPGHGQRAAGRRLRGPRRPGHRRGGPRADVRLRDDRPGPHRPDGHRRHRPLPAEQLGRTAATGRRPPGLRAHRGRQLRGRPGRRLHPPRRHPRPLRRSRRRPGGGVPVDSTATTVHPATITFATPDGYDDPAPDDHSGTVTGLRPGIDLHLSPLTPDAAPPADDADRHRVTTTLSGVRAGLASVTFSLTGDATFAGSPGCTAAGVTLTCADPSDGPVTFTLRSGDVHQSRTVRIRATAAAPFLELDESDDADSVVLAPRPSYPFELGTLTRTAQSVTGDTDHYTLRTTVAAPAGADGLVLALTDGGSLAAGQDTGCTRLDGTHLRCDGGARTVDLAVDSTRTTAHPVTVVLQVPARYDDSSAGDNTRTLTVSPGVDLHLADLRPDNASPANDDDQHLVSTRLTGVRAGLAAVTYRLTGDAGFVRASAQGCTVTDARTLTCSAPEQGDGTVTFTGPGREPAGRHRHHGRGGAGTALRGDGGRRQPATRCGSRPVRRTTSRCPRSPRPATRSPAAPTPTCCGAPWALSRRG